MKKLLRRIWWTVLVCALALLLPVDGLASAGISNTVVIAPSGRRQVTVFFRGEKLEAQPTACLKGNSACIPLRNLLEKIDPECSFSWDEETDTAKVEAAGLSLSVQVGASYLEVNGRCLSLNPPCFIEEERIMLPVRTLAAICGLEVGWNETTREVRLEGSFTPLESGDSFYDADSLYWLSRIISAEARGEPLEGQIAVGNVVLNRVARQYWPDTVYEVVFDNHCGVQFSPTVNGGIYHDPTDSAIRAAKLAMEGVKTAGESLFFLNESISSSTWFQNNLDYVIKLGNHTFYTKDIQ